MHALSRMRAPMDRRDEQGFTLVELLVVMLIMGVIGSIVTAAVSGAFGTTRRSQDRVAAMTEIQKAVERVTRELRAAHPVQQSLTTTIPAIEVAEPYQVVVNVLRDGGRIRFTYAVQNGALRETRQVYATVSATSPTRTVTDTVQAPFLRQVTNFADATPVFTYYDRFGDPTTERALVSSVAVELTRSMTAQESLNVQTHANLRNARE